MNFKNSRHCLVDTSYDLTGADLRVVEREIYEKECDPKLEEYNYFSYELIRLQVA